MRKKSAKKSADQPTELRHCRYCGGIVAPDAPSCVHCGTPSPLKEVKKTDFSEHAQVARFLWLVLGILFLISLGGILFFPGCRQ